MNKVSKTLLVTALALGAAAPASAFYWGSGWKVPATWTLYTHTVAGWDGQGNTVSIGVSYNGFPGQTLAANNTAPTRFYAASQCRRNTSPFNIVQKNGPVIAATSVGGWANHSFTPFCDAGYSLYRGGAYVDDAF